MVIIFSAKSNPKRPKLHFKFFRRSKDLFELEDQFGVFPVVNRLSADEWWQWQGWSMEVEWENEAKSQRNKFSFVPHWIYHCWRKSETKFWTETKIGGRCPLLQPGILLCIRFRHREMDKFVNIYWCVFRCFFFGPVKWSIHWKRNSVRRTSLPFSSTITL